MSTTYAQLLAADGLPDSVVACHTGHIRGKLLGMDAPPKWHGFPPALIPIWSDTDGENYIGYWKHWFTHRPGTFVDFQLRRFSPADGKYFMRALEIARTPMQLFGNIAVNAINLSKRISPDLRKFADKVSLSDLESYAIVTRKIYYQPAGFYVLPGYDRDLPLECISDVRGYTGWFPTSLPYGPQEWRKTACSFELDEDALDSWPREHSLPVWLTKTNKQKLFHEFVSKYQFEQAWLTLNSSGWKISQAKTAILELAQASRNEQFGHLANAWAAFADDSVSSY